MRAISVLAPLKASRGFWIGVANAGAAAGASVTATSARGERSAMACSEGAPVVSGAGSCGEGAVTAGPGEFAGGACGDAAGAGPGPC